MDKRIDIIVIDNDLEALALRSALEWWGVKVNMHFIGKAQDIVDIFKKENLAPYICFAAHGNEINERWGFQLIELGEEIAKKQPYDKILFPSDISEFVKLQNNHVLSNACVTGNKEMADAFLKNGAESYIGPKSAPFANASLYFALNFYYWLFAKEKSVKEAFEKSMTMIDKEIDEFVLFEK